MKHEDHSFKILVALIIAGVVAACLPSAPAKENARTHDGTAETRTAAFASTSTTAPRS